ncbi:hypothetical protein M7I_0530 [Glarea lozoyensis 74030]|uniref:Uncharacterized protein n=1 Tax=Glarea lozoyensis (strain ATCC 74030 / MF5533) TaxID=1104152 RepID=H0EDS4_GLAL7|nr:hypothetical protein M7I_0530 [Glarea lozoyensis 74030]
MQLHSIELNVTFHLLPSLLPNQGPRVTDIPCSDLNICLSVVLRLVDVTLTYNRFEQILKVDIVKSSELERSTTQGKTSSFFDDSLHDVTVDIRSLFVATIWIHGSVGRKIPEGTST